MIKRHTVLQNGHQPLLGEARAINGLRVPVKRSVHHLSLASELKESEGKFHSPFFSSPRNPHLYACLQEEQLRLTSYILIKGTGNGLSFLRLLTSFHSAHSSGKRTGFFQFPTQTGGLHHGLCYFLKLSECGAGGGGEAFHPGCARVLCQAVAGKGRGHRTQILNDGSKSSPFKSMPD